MAATTSKPSATAAAAVLLALVAAAALLAPAGASTLTVFTGPGCSGSTKDINTVCGCYDISRYQGGYQFVFAGGQKAYLYRKFSCADRNPHLLNKNARYCQNGGYKSVKMIC